MFHERRLFDKENTFGTGKSSHFPPVVKENRNKTRIKRS